MNNKAMTAGFLVAMIITLVSFVLIAGTVSRVLGSGSDKAAEELCHDSIALRAKTMINIEGKVLEGTIKPVPVLCKTIDKKIISKDREQVKEEIAQKMTRCWWMFGEGRIEDLLRGSNINSVLKVLSFENSQNQCFNCYTLTVGHFDDEKDEGISSQEMVSYLTTHPTSGATYLDYIQSSGGPGRVMITTPNILPDSQYSISMMPRNKEGGGFWGLFKSAGIATATGTVAIASISTNRNYVGFEINKEICLLNFCVNPLFPRYLLSLARSNSTYIK